ncbi:hypothetical protein [Endozoicomonas ascidiicola]|uniref:hypothetical protein n=1 Tax=Endozoicomonas ascidiicola TaxID=1698521 RepID=UPI00082F8ECB|nr:hypothetical protein [Endozoicomonas ascidiicola]
MGEKLPAAVGFILLISASLSFSAEKPLDALFDKSEVAAITDNMCLFQEAEDRSCLINLEHVQLDQYQPVIVDRALSTDDLSVSSISIIPELLPAKSHLKNEKLLLLDQGFERSDQLYLCKKLSERGFDAGFLVQGARPLLSEPSRFMLEQSYLVSPAAVLKELVNADPIVVVVDQPIPDKLQTYSELLYQLTTGDQFWPQLEELHRIHSQSGLRPIVLIDPEPGFSEEMFNHLQKTNLNSLFIMDGSITDVVNAINDGIRIELSKKRDLSRKKCI